MRTLRLKNNYGKITSLFPDALSTLTLALTVPHLPKDPGRSCSWAPITTHILMWPPEQTDVTVLHGNVPEGAYQIPKEKLYPLEKIPAVRRP